MVTTVNTPTIIKNCNEVADTLEARGEKIDAMTIRAAAHRLNDLLFERDNLAEQVIKHMEGESDG